MCRSVDSLRILEICITSSILRVLISEFWVSGSQVPSSRVHFQSTRYHSPIFRAPGWRIASLKVPVTGSRVSGFCIPESNVSLNFLVYLNQIKHCGINQHRIRNKLNKIKNFCRFLCNRTQCITNQLCHWEQGRSTGWWRLLKRGSKMCSKQSDYLREALEEIKNFYIKERDT